MSKLICMGECLIDFIEDKNSQLTFMGKAGGAPSNVCACVGKLGADAYYLGCMAKDNFGKYLFDKLVLCNVKTDYITYTDKAGTGLAFVSLDETGDRSFSFYRNPCADMLLSPDDVKKEMFNKGDVLHFCSVDLVDCPTKESHKKAISYAKENGAIISFDVNLRLNIWNDTPKCLSVVKEFLSYADVVKVTDDELYLICDTNDIEKGVSTLFSLAKNAKLVFITMGEKGSIVYDRQGNFYKKDAEKVKVVDTTGAGDCFSGVIIYNILQGVKLDVESMKKAVDMASRGCSVVIGKKGAMESMPSIEDIK